MKVSVVLNLSKKNDIHVTLDADNYCASISAASNLNFVVPAVSTQVAAAIVLHVANVKTASANLKTALGAPTSDIKTDNIRSARSVLDSQLGILANSIENVANSPTVLDINREGIIHSAGMQIKTATKRKKEIFKVINATDKGSGIVLIKAPGKANAHLWEYTDDLVDFKGRVAAEATTQAQTYIDSLESGKKYAFFHKPISPKGPHPWEGPEFLMVG